MAKDNMVTKPSKQPNKQLSREFTADDVREYLKRELTFEGHPKDLLEKIGASLVRNPDIRSNDELNEFLQKVSLIMNLDNHVLLSRSTTEKYRAYSIEFADLITKEYACDSPSEKALVDVITSAYIRSLQYAEFLSNSLSGEVLLTPERIGLYGFLGKEIDRAQRQFNTGLTTLRQLKAPTVPITVKTTTAFIAQNQQINSNESSDDEINKPK